MYFNASYPYHYYYQYLYREGVAGLSSGVSSTSASKSCKANSFPNMDKAVLVPTGRVRSLDDLPLSLSKPGIKGGWKISLSPSFLFFFGDFLLELLLVFLFVPFFVFPFRFLVELVADRLLPLFLPRPRFDFFLPRVLDDLDLRVVEVRDPVPLRERPRPRVDDDLSLLAVTGAAADIAIRDNKIQ